MWVLLVAPLAEFGLVAPVGRKGVANNCLLPLGMPVTPRVPEVARACIASPGRPAVDAEGADPGVRPPDHGLAPIQRDKQAARCHSWHWSGTGYRPGRQRHRSKGIPIGTELLSLDRSRAKAALKRGQGQARQHQASKAIARSLFTAGALAVIRYAKIHGPNIDPGLRHCWRGDRPRWLPSPSPTRWTPPDAHFLSA
jgi:transposase